MLDRISSWRPYECRRSRRIVSLFRISWFRLSLALLCFSGPTWILNAPDRSAYKELTYINNCCFSKKKFNDILESAMIYHTNRLQCGPIFIGEKICKWMIINDFLMNNSKLFSPFSFLSFFTICLTNNKRNKKRLVREEAKWAKYGYLDERWLENRLIKMRHFALLSLFLSEKRSQKFDNNRKIVIFAFLGGTLNRL